MPADCDLAIVGSGFGGSLLAMIARRLGYRVMLLERGTHPRFAIGESASPLAGIVIEQLADRYDLPRIRPLSAYGTWQRTYPHITCGLKRGFTYFRHDAGTRYQANPDRSNQLLVAASPNNELSDTHWLRADVDHFLVGEAIAAGAEYVDELQLDGVEWTASGHSILRGTRRGVPLSIRAQFIVDASGPHGFLSRALKIRNIGFARYPNTQALFSHFTGVARCDEMPEFGVAGTPEGAPYEGSVPYAADNAALHHVFDGGWMWVLRFENGVTSAGIAVTDDLAAELRIADGAPGWARFLARYPSIAAQFADAQPIREFTCMPKLAWRVEQASGPGWAMLPSAAAFIDPLFSTGMPLTLLGIERLARTLESEAPRKGAPYECAETVRRYANVTLAEADHTAQFIAGCYASFPNFRQFVAYSMFYFAAASYSEMVRRTGTPTGDERFLCAHHESFKRATLNLSPAHRGWDAGYDDAIASAVAPFNIAGLCNPAKRNWYPFEVASSVS